MTETSVSKTLGKGFVRQQTSLFESIARHRSRKYKTFNCLEPFFGISDTSIVRFGQLQSNRYQAQQICCCRRRRRRRRFATDDATVTTTSASSSCRHRHRHCCLFGKFGFFCCLVYFALWVQIFDGTVGCDGPHLCLEREGLVMNTSLESPAA